MQDNSKPEYLHSHDHLSIIVVYNVLHNNDTMSRSLPFKIVYRYKLFFGKKINSMGTFCLCTTMDWTQAKTSL